MDASDHLHDPPVAPRQPTPVDVLHAAQIRMTVFRDRNAGFAGQDAGHAGRPEQFVTDLPTRETMYLIQEAQRFSGTGQRRSDEFQQRFGVISRDPRMGQRRTERGRMGDLRDIAIRRDPQRLPLQAQQATGKAGGRTGIEQPAQALVKNSVQDLRLADAAIHIQESPVRRNRPCQSGEGARHGPGFCAFYR